MTNTLYWLCTDFCVSMANLLGTTYVEFNMMLFLFIMPGVVFVLVGLNIWRYWLRPLIGRNER